MDVLRNESEMTVTRLAELDAQVKFHQAVGALEDAVQRPLDGLTAPTPAVVATNRRAAPPNEGKKPRK